MKHTGGNDGGAGGPPPAAYPGYHAPYPGMPAASGYMRPQGHAESEPYKFQAGMPVPAGPQSDTGKDDDMSGTTMRPQHRNNDSNGPRRMALPGRAPATALSSRPGAAGSAAAAGGGQIIRRKGGPMRGTHPAEINKQITTAKEVWLIVDIVLQHGAEFDAVNVACPEDPTELLRSSGFEQLLLMVEAQVLVQGFLAVPILACSCSFRNYWAVRVLRTTSFAYVYVSDAVQPVLTLSALLDRLTNANHSILPTSCGRLAPWGTSPANICWTSSPSKLRSSCLGSTLRIWPTSSGHSQGLDPALYDPSTPFVFHAAMTAS